MRSLLEALIPLLRDSLQIVASLVIIPLGLAAWRILRGGGNRVQLDIEMQIIDVGSSRDVVGELMVVLQNMGPRPQRIRNLFLEVRPSRHAPTAGVAMLPVSNMIAPDDHPFLLAPGVRQTLTWTFEIPKEERLLRATALISMGKYMVPDAVPALSQKHFYSFGPTARYVSRVFEVSPAPFRRF